MEAQDGGGGKPAKCTKSPGDSFGSSLSGEGQTGGEWG